MPLIALRGAVIFPGMTLHFDMVRKPFIQALKEAMKTNRMVVLVTQKETLEEEPDPEDLYDVGVIAEVRQVLRTPDNVTRVLVKGIQRVRTNAVYRQEKEIFFRADADAMPELPFSQEQQTKQKALGRRIKDAFQKYADLMPRISEELTAAVICEEDDLKLFDHIVFHLPLDYTEKQQLLEEYSWEERLFGLYQFLSREVEVLYTERDLHAKTKTAMESLYRQTYLKEQQRVIAAQLGEADSMDGENGNHYLEKIRVLPTDEESKQQLEKQAVQLSHLPPFSQEANVIQTYLDTVLALPWNQASRLHRSLSRAESVLERDHYGLEKVKERILEHFAVHILHAGASGQVLCLVGPPGVGKSSIAKSIAAAAGRKFQRISLGGIRDEADIRGHRKTYIGAMPGRIMDALTRAKTNNPLILLDEVDKLGVSHQGNPAAALLEVLDFDQNKAFRDHYIEASFDLSHVLFIATANDMSTIPAPLLDRMEVIELGSYTREEKFHIAKLHLVKKQLKQNGLKGTQCRLTDDAIYGIIDSYTREAGVRELERTIGILCRKVAKQIVSGETKKVVLTEKQLQPYLGVAKFRPDAVNHKDAVGVVNGLAWTSVGGVLMPIEVLPLPGKGAVEITGSLGDVMKESARLAVSYTRSKAKKYGISDNYFTEHDIHIHAPEGAVPKDGPSAGVTMTTALISAISGRPVRGDVAMTGEITLHGKVLPIGGLREKSMAAYKNGISTVIIPADNLPDLEEVDETVKENVRFIPAKTLDTVLETALVSTTETERPKQPVPAEPKKKPAVALA